MKILAATSVNYSRTRYIIECTSDELAAFTTFNGYKKIPVVDSQGKVLERDKDNLESGDIIAPDYATETLDNVRLLIDSKEEIQKGFTTAKATMTKIQNLLSKTL